MRERRLAAQREKAAAVVQSAQRARLARGRVGRRRQELDSLLREAREHDRMVGESVRERLRAHEQAAAAATLQAVARRRRVRAEPAMQARQARRAHRSKVERMQAEDRAARELQELPLFIDDTPGLTIAALRTRARRLKRRHDVGFIVVDYLQLLQGSGRGNENRVNEISEISRGLKTLAKELHVPVLALSQLSRAVEQREDKRPQLSDLRESGSIEQDADMVWFVFREDYYIAAKEPGNKESAEHTEWAQQMEQIYGLAELIVAKQRHGSTGRIRMKFDARITRFSDIAEDGYQDLEYE